MLEYYFKAPWCLDRLRRGPVGPHIDDIAASLHERGYRKGGTARPVLRIIAKFSVYGEAVGIKDAKRIRDTLVERFLRNLAREGKFPEARSAMNHLLEHLRRHGVISERVPAWRREPFGALLHRYEQYLDNIRGLPDPTREDYRRGVHRFLLWLRREARLHDLRRLRGTHVLAYVTDLADLHDTRSWRNRLTSQTRLFLRYLLWEGTIRVDLARVVPKIASSSLASIPRHLSWHLIRGLVDSIDTTQDLGKRDKAVLLLIAVLGMRGKNVRTLKLEHVRWRSAQIYLPQTKSQRAQVLPMPQEVGSALADYIRHGRPRSSARNVILRHHPPVGPLSSPSAVGRIVARRLRRLPIEAPNRPGTQLVRHSLATQMVNAGAPIKQIADLLGHRSIDTTAIYTKVDVSSLSAVALPFPGQPT